MIFIQPLRTRHLTISMKELTISQSMAIAAMPVNREQAECTAFLRAAVDSVKPELDPADWTVQERIFALCHYLAAVSDGAPDFEVGTNAHYSDYLMTKDIDSVDERISIGELEKDKWQIQHLTGRMVESVERLKGEVLDAHGNPLADRAHWLLGCMAAQLVMEGEDVPKAKDNEGAFDEFLTNRMRVFAAYPESAFSTLLYMYFNGREKLEHLFKIDVSGSGIECIAVKEGADGQPLPRARFPARSCLTEIAIRMVESTT